VVTRLLQAHRSIDRPAGRPAGRHFTYLSGCSPIPFRKRNHWARGQPAISSEPTCALSLSHTHTQITDRRILPQVITGFGEFRFCSIALNFSLARPYAVNHTWGSTDYGHTRSPYDTPLFEVPLPFLLYMTVNSLGISLRLFSCSLVRVFFEHDDRQ
jgi:hypothetical protein